MCLTLVLWLFGAAAYGQGLELQGGVSNLLDAEGASAIYTTGAVASEIDLGVAQNHFVYGAGVHFQRHGCGWFAGDHQETFSTTVSGLSAANRGFAIECRSKSQSIRVFAGATGDLHSTPFFTETESRHLGTGVEYTRVVDDFELTGVAGFDGGNHVLLESVKYHRGAFRAEESAGVALGQKYFEGQASYQLRHVSASLNHVDYLGIGRTTSEQITAGGDHLSAFASAFQSRISGTAFGAIVNVGRVSATAMELSSGTTRQMSEFVSERISQRFSATEVISGRNVSFGGSMTGNLVSASVGYQELWTPTNGFQRATTFTLRLQLTRGTVNASVSALPAGIFYTGYAGIVAQGPALAGSVSDHAAP